MLLVFRLTRRGLWRARACCLFGVRALVQLTFDPWQRVRLFGPVGERPVHVFLLRAGEEGLGRDVRLGLMDGVRSALCFSLSLSLNSLPCRQRERERRIH